MENSTVTKILCSGALILSKETKRFLFLLRTKGKTAGTWGLVGGKSEIEDKNNLDTLTREIKEELGKSLKFSKIIPLDFFKSEDSNFSYGTYIILVDKEFIPTLNNEHNGFSWCPINSWPKPLHKGVQLSLNNKIIKTKLELLIDLV